MALSSELWSSQVFLAFLHSPSGERTWRGCGWVIALCSAKQALMKSFHWRAAFCRGERTAYFRMAPCPLSLPEHEGMLFYFWFFTWEAGRISGDKTCECYLEASLTSICYSPILVSCHYVLGILLQVRRPGLRLPSPLMGPRKATGP